MLSPSFVILNEMKDLNSRLRINSAKHLDCVLRVNSVKDLGQILRWRSATVLNVKHAAHT